MVADHIVSKAILLFYVIGNSVGIPYYIKRHCVPESAVRGEEYIAVLSARARKCASSAHFVLSAFIKQAFAG